MGSFYNHRLNGLDVLNLRAGQLVALLALVKRGSKAHRTLVEGDAGLDAAGGVKVRNAKLMKDESTKLAVRDQVISPLQCVSNDWNRNIHTMFLMQSESQPLSILSSSVKVRLPICRCRF